ncbi:unnamed protein product [Pedinophyceae sp. YPF-701]|nr:unnamed protein product [Pedinophyceae sp. YPF-701]
MAAKRKAAPPAPARKRARTAQPAQEGPVAHPSHQKEPAELFVWGDGDCGQLGLGEATTERLRPWPLDVGGGQKVLQVACGGMHTAVLTERHEVWTWGVNDEGALGRHTAGKLWEASGLGSGKPGDSYTPGVVAFPAGSARIVQVSAGDSHTCCLAEDGTVFAWGTFRDASGVLGFSPAARFQLVPRVVVAPRSDRVCKVASGADHVVALCESGKLLTFGNGQQGQLGRLGTRVSERHRLQEMLTPAETRVVKRKAAGVKVTDVACGTYHTFAQMSDGRIFAAGLNNYGQLGLEDEDAYFSFTEVEQLKEKGVATVRGGQHHSLALTNKGTLLAFGRAAYGRLGRAQADTGEDGKVADALPVEGLGGVKVTGMAGGLAVSGCFGDGEKTGQIWLWGMGTNNQLANGDEDDDVSVPERVKETKKYNALRCVQLEFGGQHAACLAVERPGETRVV